MNRIQEASRRLAAASGSPVARRRQPDSDSNPTRRRAYLDQLLADWKRRLDRRA